MTVDFITLFPEMVEAVLGTSILSRAQEKGFLNLRTHNLRDYTHDRHRTVDDRPYGGGPGMVMMCDPLVEAIESIQSKDDEKAHVVFMSPQGSRLEQKKSAQLAEKNRLMVISGHYEGVDERVLEDWVDEEISIGDYVLTNGTLSGMVMVDSVVRLIPGVLGNESSKDEESFGEHGLLEGPVYTRPEEFRGKRVPDILLSGNHAAIEAWRHEKAVERTRERRSDLLLNASNEGEAL